MTVSRANAFAAFFFGFGYRPGLGEARAAI
jgi:hypothetical protein